MACRGPVGIRGFLDTGTDFRRLRPALWTVVRRWPIPRSTSRAERRWDWPPTRRQARSCRGRGALLCRRPAPAA